MKEMLEKLWNEYLFEECASLESEEERRLTRTTLELHEKVNALLNNEQKDAVEKYIASLCDTDAILTKKAFFKGCEFAVSFLLESRNIQ